jgi:hypothetical protein
MVIGSPPKRFEISGLVTGVVDGRKSFFDFGYAGH